MRAANITALGQPPIVVDASPPLVASGEALVAIDAVSFNPVDIAIGSGTFYAGHPALPYVPGIEAAGRLDGRPVFAQGAGLGIARNGLAAGVAVVPPAALIALPAGIDPATAAALGTAGLAGWMAIHEADVSADDVVVVLGATGTVGSVAMQAARLSGAKRVVAVGRPSDRLAHLSSIADATVSLGDEYAARLTEACGGAPSVVIDLLWGQPIIDTLSTVAPRGRVVHVGASAAPFAELPSAAIRGRQLRIIGYSNFGLNRDEFAARYLELVDRACTGDIDISITRFSLDQVADAWTATATASAKAVVCFMEDDR